MGRTVMSRNIKLDGLELFLYLIDRFGNTPKQALKTMQERGQDTKAAELFVDMLTKQQQTERENK